MNDIERLKEAHREAFDAFNFYYNVKGEKENADYYNGITQGVWLALGIVQVYRIKEKENAIVFPKEIKGLIQGYKDRIAKARREFKMSNIQSIKMSAFMRIIRDSTDADNTQKVEAIWEILTF